MVSGVKKRIQKELVLASLSEAVEGAVVGVLLSDQILWEAIAETEEVSQAVLQGWQELEDTVKVIPALKIVESRESQSVMDWE
jgi:ligand-binding sensor protein